MQKCADKTGKRISQRRKLFSKNFTLHSETGLHTRCYTLHTLWVYSAIWHLSRIWGKPVHNTKMISLQSRDGNSTNHENPHTFTSLLQVFCAESWGFRCVRYFFRVLFLGCWFVLQLKLLHSILCKGIKSEKQIYSGNLVWVHGK